MIANVFFRCSEGESGCEKCTLKEDHIDQLESQLQYALSEVNQYRALLGLPPVKQLKYNLPTHQLLKNQLHIPNSSLESLPNEILDKIACYVDSTSLFTLCHAIPFYKHISHTLYTTAQVFKLRKVSDMWPHFSFDPTLQIPLHAAIHLHNLSRLLSKYDGSGLISPTSLEYLTSITPFLPKTIGVNLTFSTLPLEDITAILTHLSSLSLRIRLLSLPLPHLFSTSPQNNPFTDSTFTSTLKTLSAEAYIFLGDTQPPHASILKYMPSLRILCFFNPTLFPCSVLMECPNITCLFVQKPRCSVEALKELVDALKKTGLWKVVFEWEGEEGEKGLETVRSLEVHMKEVGWSVRDDEGKVSWRRKA